MHRRSVAAGPLALTALVCLSLLALGPRGEAQERPPSADYAGRWEGTVLFANGWRAQATVWLEPAETGLSGRYEVRMLGEDGPGAPQSGRLAVELATETAQLIDAKRQLTFDGALAEAGSHAEAAFLGSFEQAGQAGVFLLWRYRGR